MEIRPDRFKIVAAKTLGKIYGYVKISLGQITTRKCVNAEWGCRHIWLGKVDLLLLNWATGEHIDAEK